MALIEARVAGYMLDLVESYLSDRTLVYKSGNGDAQINSYRSAEINPWSTVMYDDVSRRKDKLGQSRG